MTELTPSAQMNHEQKKAMDVWLESATFDNDFETISDRRLCDVLKAEHGIETSKSAIERMRKKFNWNGFLDLKKASVMVSDPKAKDIIDTAIGEGAAKKTVVDVERNSKLTSSAYEIMELKLLLIKETYDETNKISLDDAKFAKDVALLTSGREDKLLDRAALMGAAKLLSKEDVIEALRATTIEIDDGDDIFEDDEDEDEDEGTKE